MDPKAEAVVRNRGKNMKTVENTLTVSNFLAFAQSKPADATYDFSDGSNCAVAQFLKSEHVPFKWVGGYSVMLTQEQIDEAPGFYKGPEIPSKIVDAMEMGEVRTWGMLAENLKTIRGW